MHIYLTLVMYCKWVSVICAFPCISHYLPLNWIHSTEGVAFLLIPLLSLCLLPPPHSMMPPVQLHRNWVAVILANVTCLMQTNIEEVPLQSLKSTFLNSSPASPFKKKSIGCTISLTMVVILIWLLNSV